MMDDRRVELLLLGAPQHIAARRRGWTRRRTLWRRRVPRE